MTSYTVLDKSNSMTGYTPNVGKNYNVSIGVQNRT